MKSLASFPTCSDFFSLVMKIPCPPGQSLCDRVRSSALVGAIYPREYLSSIDPS